MLELKERSHRRVFSLIRSQGSVSGAVLARQTEMQPSSLVYILRHLKDKNLIKVSGLGNSTQKGGKRPVLWEINPSYGNIVGLEVMRQAIRGVMVNIAGDVILKVEKEFKPGRTEKNISRIIATINEILNESGEDQSKLLYISLAIPGIVNPESYQVVYSFGLKMEDFDLRSHIAGQFHVPVGIINDANAGALSEQWFSRTESPLNNILYIMYNPQVGGMGLGVVINQKLYSGSNGLAGELFSRVPSLEQILEEIRKKEHFLTSLIPESTNLALVQVGDLYNYSKKGCQLSRAALLNLSRLVAKELSRIAGLFDPERIIIGGDLSICEDLCCNEISNSLTELMHHNYPFDVKVPRIQYARTKIFSAAIGATALYLSDELSL